MNTHEDFSNAQLAEQADLGEVSVCSNAEEQRRLLKLFEIFISIDKKRNEQRARNHNGSTDLSSEAS
ncbi:hypothetical protein IT402_02800 [Candidatus Nomurabacteria bacterium]|nr:hypothetical protein [Candidatus Nomurabacteria bacterium]